MLDALLAEARLRWGLDLAAGIAVIPAERLVATPIEPSRPAIVAPLALLRPGGSLTGEREDSAGGETAVAPLPGRHGPDGRDRLAVLRRLYPGDHPVGRFGAADATTVRALTETDLAAPLYLAPVAPELASSPLAMPYISERLRRPDGCPWDREQTHTTLRSHLLEEAYEVYDALAGGATPGLVDELGDLWLQIVLHAQLAAEEGVFDLADVETAIASKIVRRHPHVFGDAEAHTAMDVNRQWERIKAAERASGDSDTSVSTSALEGISRSLPALAASQEMQERAAHIGYDWPTIEGVLDKVTEELAELREASTDDERAEEFGDLLMVLVNVARKHGIEAEGALRGANAKFRRRFGIVERLAAERSVALRDLSFEALDELWDAAKVEEMAGHHEEAIR